jgi:hypothetical protein
MNDVNELGAKLFEQRFTECALKNRILHALTISFTCLRNFSQSFATGGIGRVDVVAYKYVETGRAIGFQVGIYGI